MDNQENDSISPEIKAVIEHIDGKFALLQAEQKNTGELVGEINKRLKEGEKRFTDHGERIAKNETGVKWLAKVGGGVTAAVTTGFGFIVRYWPKC